MKPLVGVTMGDPAGVGPEIVLKALLDPDVRRAARCLVLGDRGVLERMRARLNIDVQIRTAAGDDAECGVAVRELSALAEFEFGKVDARCGAASYEYIAEAVRLAECGAIDAIATAPINKEALRAGGVSDIGHTEILTRLSRSEEGLTMFELEKMRIFFFSRHVSLLEACALVKRDTLVAFAEACLGELLSLGVNELPLAIAALNPHGGEGGRFGAEEIREIIPAVCELQRRGRNVVGPIPADSVFHQAREGKFSGVVSLYHDQGHVAAKTADFHRTVAVTLGLPFLRTSVDHGTAYDIAGRGEANAAGMKEAIIVAARYAAQRRR